ncbi:MAG: Diguanylate cyclase [Bacteroidetes bacterium]|jgi:diguanylate cyclase (GGDEF)-like protein|nr:Diguanylate cyclase [Bacteroidota bacterium]
MADGAAAARATWLRWIGAGVALLCIAAFCVVAEESLFPYDGVLGAGFFAFMRKKISGQSAPDDVHAGEQHVSDHDGTARQANLLFDDFQAAEAYHVKDAAEEHQVVPSTRTGRPVAGEPHSAPLREAEVIDFFDVETDVPAQESEPRGEFHTLLNRVLLVLKSVLFCNTSAFFWLNREKQQLVLEGVATDSQTFTSLKRLPLAEDLLSQVAGTGKPRILSSVNPQGETDLLRYYEKAAGVHSAIAVPVFYKSEQHQVEPVGVLVADSTAEDAFGQETVETLGKFTKLLSALIKTYTDKYDLLIDAEMLSSIRRLQDAVKSNPGEQAILAALVEESGRLAGWEYLTITMFAEDARNWVVQRVVNHAGEQYVLPSQAVDVEGSVVGEAITGNRVEVVPDLSSDERPRFHRDEQLPNEGSFVAVPISSFNRCYGALTLETRKEGGFSGAEVESLYRLVENGAAALEVGYMNDLVREFASTEHLTGMMTKKFFLRRVEEEVQRADDTRAELAYVAFAVDEMEEHMRRYGRHIQDVIHRELVTLLRQYLRPYDCIGRQDGQMIGVVLANMTASDAYLWAEKLRKTIASHVIAHGQKTFSVTVSLGVCGLSERMNARDLMSGATQVHNKAKETGGNAVRVF